MRISRLLAFLTLLIGCFVLFSAGLSAQQSSPSVQSVPTGTPSPHTGLPGFITGPNLTAPPPLAQSNSQGAALLGKTLAAVGAQSPLTDITLVGQLTRPAPGSAANSGTITMAARGDTQAEITLDLPAGTSVEIRSISADGASAEMLTAPNGTVTHGRPGSLFTPYPAWFFPQFVLSAQPQSNLSSAFIGSETRAGVPVNHIEVWRSPSGSSTTPAVFLQHNTQCDVYLDPSTSLPLSMVYWVQPIYPVDPPAKYFHKDNRVPIEIQFSNYQAVQGIPVAHQLSVFVQGRQLYTIQLSSVKVNSGVAIPVIN